MLANISEKFIFKPQDCDLGTITNSDCYLDTSLWSPGSSKLNSPSHPSEPFFSTSNDSGRAMHNKYMVHRQLLSLLSNKSLICYLVNIVTLKIQRLNQWISLPVSCIWSTQNAIHCSYSQARHSTCIYITVCIHEPSSKKCRKTTKMLKGNVLFTFLSLSPLLWCPLAALKGQNRGVNYLQRESINTWFQCAILYFIKIRPSQSISDWQDKILCCILQIL